MEVTGHPSKGHLWVQTRSRLEETGLGTLVICPEEWIPDHSDLHIEVNLIRVVCPGKGGWFSGGSSRGLCVAIQGQDGRSTWLYGDFNS